jgi:endonuclease/exonuclease/phosphatase family metal-dependent hydrolase
VLYSERAPSNREHDRGVHTPTAGERAAWVDALGDAELHARLLGQLECLHHTEGDAVSGADAALSGWVRLAAWNVQRGRRPAALAALLHSCAADVALVSELDSGMARTRNTDVPAELARTLGCAYGYGVEFVELGPGDELERVEAAGAPNHRGLHGNAVLARTQLHDPDVVRLSDGGPVWFDANSTQPRVGGRMALVAAVDIDDTRVELASTHLENRADPAGRAEEMEVLLRALDARGGRGPAVVGGDLNTLSVPLAELTNRDQVCARRAAEPARFTWPVAHEPLFEVAAAYGYHWNEANVAAPTTAHDETGRPGHVPLRLDWLLVRGLEARRPAVIPSAALSDHHVVSVSVRIPRT